MIADVWSKRDFVAAVIVLAAMALVGVGRWLDVRILTAAGGVVAIVGMAVFIAGRVMGGREERNHDDRWV